MVPIDAAHPTALRKSECQLVQHPFRGAPIGTNPQPPRWRSKNQPVSHLLIAALRACDHWNDSPVARQEMRRQIAEVPPEHRAELLAHFERVYPAQEADSWR